MSEKSSASIHHGRNVKRFREMLGIKQEAFASSLGEDWSQKKVSLLEAKEIIDPQVLSHVAEILKIPADAIKNFDEDAALNIISNTFNSYDSSTLNAINNHPVFNPLSELMKAIDENKNLYERLLQSEKEKVILLEKTLSKTTSG